MEMDLMPSIIASGVAIGIIGIGTITQSIFEKLGKDETAEKVKIVTYCALSAPAAVIAIKFISAFMELAKLSS